MLEVIRARGYGIEQTGLVSDLARLEQICTEVDGIHNDGLNCPPVETMLHSEFTISDH